MLYNCNAVLLYYVLLYWFFILLVKNCISILQYWCNAVLVYKFHNIYWLKSSNTVCVCYSHQGPIVFLQEFQNVCNPHYDCHSTFLLDGENSSSLLWAAVWLYRHMALVSELDVYSFRTLSFYQFHYTSWHGSPFRFIEGGKKLGIPLTGIFILT